MKVAPEAWPFVVPLVAVAALCGVFLHPAIGAVLLAPIAFTLWFFRDPERVTPDDPGTLISPADGKIIRTGPDRISIFMNVFNVHVCRSPLAGRIESVEHIQGKFMAAFRDPASEQNERVVLDVENGSLKVRFVLIAGLVARRIVCKVAAGTRLAAGERVGLIRFGSRVDVVIPEGSEVLVALGQHVVAGETRLARMSGSPIVGGVDRAKCGRSG
jgi:phosphatidylserine decarboxylase